MTIQNLESRLKEANVPFTKIVDNSCGFFSIYYKGNTVKSSNTFFKSVRKIENLDMCRGERGFNKINGHWQCFKFWN